MKFPSRITAALAVATLIAVGGGTAASAGQVAVLVSNVQGRVVSCTPNQIVPGEFIMNIEISADVFVPNSTARDLSARATTSFGGGSSSYSVGGVQTEAGFGANSLIWTGEGMAGSPTLEIMYDGNVVASSSGPVLFECPPTPDPEPTPDPTVDPTTASSTAPVVVNVVPAAHTDGFDHVARAASHLSALRLAM